MSTIEIEKTEFAKEKNDRKVKEKNWICGHPTNSLKECAVLTATSHVTTIADMRKLGKESV